MTMAHIGIDIEQFTVDPQSSGIQRVLQYLARTWPDDIATCDFVVPYGDEYLLLEPAAADRLVSLAFTTRDGAQLRVAVAGMLEDYAGIATHVRRGELLSLYTSWLLPEVSYLPSVLDRFDLFSQSMKTAMIGYDALPMTEPANYRFTPGTAADVSEYFRRIATTDSLVCISDYSRNTITRRLRRSPERATSVAHPGGDHVAVHISDRPTGSPLRFLRVGTLESRKMPRELVAAFRAARAQGIDAELHFLGRPSASDADINIAVTAAVDEGMGIHWNPDTDDAEIERHILNSDFFLSFGTEGYGIPVLEALRLGTPVLFGGVQPAAEIMVGHGAIDVGGIDAEHLTEMFLTYADPAAARDARQHVDSEAIPTWESFTRAVALAAR